jgi:hypothetical protein
LPEFFQIFERQIVAGEVETRVEQHRRVAARQHESIAIWPMRIGGVVSHDARKKHVAERCERHRRPRVTGLGFLNSIHGQRANGIDAKEIEIGTGHCSVRRWAKDSSDDE